MGNSSISYGNYTLYGIHDRTERYCWAVYHILVLLSSLIGDTLILYASFQPDAFKLNKILVVVIQHIAFSNLALALPSAFPTAISLLTNSWELGDATCYVDVYMIYSMYPVGIMLVAVMTTTKFFLLRHPLQSSNWTKKTANRICVSMWVLCLLAVPVTFLVLRKDDVQFDHRIYICDYGFTDEAWKMIKPAYSIIFQFIPCCIIIGTTISTLKYLANARKFARRVKGSIPWQGGITVVSTAVIYCISNLPLFAYFIGKSFVQESSGSLFHVHYFRAATFLTRLNIMANFYIYTLTIRSFRRFLLAMILTIVPDSLLPSRNNTSGNINFDFGDFNGELSSFQFEVEIT